MRDSAAARRAGYVDGGICACSAVAASTTIRPNAVRRLMRAIIAATTAGVQGRFHGHVTIRGTCRRATVKVTHMKKLSALVAVALGVAALRPAAACAQDSSPLAGVWTLNRSLSDLPREIGFNVDWLPRPVTPASHRDRTPVVDVDVGDPVAVAAAAAPQDPTRCLARVPRMRGVFSS